MLRKGFVMGVATVPHDHAERRHHTPPDGDLARGSMLYISALGALAVTVVVAFITAAGAEWMAVFGIAVAILAVTALMLMFLSMVREDDDEEARE